MASRNRSAARGTGQLKFESRYNGCSDLVLNLEDIGHLPLVLLRPNLSFVSRIDELDMNP